MDYPGPGWQPDIAVLPRRRAGCGDVPQAGFRGVCCRWRLSIIRAVTSG